MTAPADFRMGERETLAGPVGPVTIQVCEEYDAESGRWEPFVTILKGKIR
jgi:hypothetical protein